MKKYAKLLLTLGLALPLVACQGGQSAEPDPAKEESSKTVEKSDTKSEEADKGTEKTDDSKEESEKDGEATAETITVKDIHGEVEVPKHPERVVALDNRTFQTLEDWGVDLVAVPKDVMPNASAYKQDDELTDLGNHREPDLEALVAADPDLVIVGQRFASYYDEIKELVPNAAVIDLNIDVSEEAENPAENFENGLKDDVKVLGQIFDKEEEAEKLATAFDDAVNRAKEAYNGEDKVLAVVVAGQKINYIAPEAGRIWGPIYPLLGLKPAIETDQESSDHKGQDISLEAIAQSKPDWLLVFDRDAAVSEEGEEVKPAEEIINTTSSLSHLPAVEKGQLLIAPADTYLSESIQTWTKILNEMAEKMEAEK